MDSYPYYNENTLTGSFKLEPIIDLANQTVEVSESGARVSALIGEASKMQHQWFKDVSTLYERFRQGARESKSGECFGSEFVAPEKLEKIYVRSRFVGQIFVHGNSLKSGIVAVVSPDPETLPVIAEKELGLKGTMAELCKEEKIKKAILDDLEAIGKKVSFMPFELVKDVYLYPELFTVESGLITPTFKSKRAVLREKFQQQLDEMYRKLD